MDGVNAPLIRGFDERGESLSGELDIGVDDDMGVDTSLTVLDPFVAAIDGELGGSGDLV